MEKPVIRLQNIWKIYRLGKVSVPALRGVDLEIFPGSFVSIMGPSGSGKSTLLNMMGCLDSPTKGKVFLDEEDVFTFSENQLARVRGKRIGFVFQQFNLLQNLSAIENVMIPMVFQKVSEEERTKRAQLLLSLVGLQGRERHLPSELSGGERQRVALARAFANKPKLVIADEPTGNLDSHSGQRVMDLLMRFHKEEKGTIVVVTHDPVIAKYSERVFHIKDGQIVDSYDQQIKK